MSATLIVCYSLSGNTRAAAVALRDRLGGDLLEIRDRRQRRGATAWARSVWEVLIGAAPPIEAAPRELSKYQVVVLAAPVWAGRPASPMRTWLRAHRARLPDVALLCTVGRTGAQGALDRLARLAGKAPRAMVAVTDSDRVSGADEVLLDEFADAISPQPDSPAARAAGGRPAGLTAVKSAGA